MREMREMREGVREMRGKKAGRGVQGGGERLAKPRRPVGKIAVA